VTGGKLVNRGKKESQDPTPQFHSELSRLLIWLAVALSAGRTSMLLPVVSSSVSTATNTNYLMLRAGLNINLEAKSELL